jgi:hypothetical protein
MNDKPTSLNAEGISEPFASENVPLEEWSKGTRYGTKFRYLSGFGGANHVGVALEELAPGKESNMNHYHMLEEEQAFILEGEGSRLLSGRAESRTFVLQPQRHALPVHHDRREKPERSRCLSRNRTRRRAITE